MGNGLSPCFNPFSERLVKIVYWGGSTEVVAAEKKPLAGEVMFRFPDSIVCDADAFYIGRPVPVLSLEDELRPGRTYFVLPIDKLPACHGPLTAVSLSALSPWPAKPSLAAAGSNGGGGQCPFAYVRDGDGRALIKVLPEFLTKVISAADGGQRFAAGGDGGALCSTPELKKHYAQLVGPRERPWSTTLETITESKKRALLHGGGSLSPVRLLGLMERRPC